jgi:ribosomal-protein-serine acetyltransferase
MKIMISPRLHIRTLVPTDALALFRLIDLNRAFLRNWLAWLDLTQSLQDSQRFIETAIYRYYQSESASFAICYQNDIVGIAGFNSFDFPNKLGVIGYWLSQEHTQKGIVTAVVSRLLDYGFNELKLNKIEIRCAVENHPSRSVPERLGFVLEGQLRQCEWLYDHYVDHCVYSLLANEFKGRNWLDSFSHG